MSGTALPTFGVRGGHVQLPFRKVETGVLWGAGISKYQLSIMLLDRRGMEIIWAYDSAGGERTVCRMHAESNLLVRVFRPSYESFTGLRDR